MHGIHLQVVQLKEKIMKEKNKTLAQLSPDSDFSVSLRDLRDNLEE